MGIIKNSFHKGSEALTGVSKVWKLVRIIPPWDGLLKIGIYGFDGMVEFWLLKQTFEQRNVNKQIPHNHVLGNAKKPGKMSLKRNEISHCVRTY